MNIFTVKLTVNTSFTVNLQLNRMKKRHSYFENFEAKPGQN